MSSLSSQNSRPPGAPWPRPVRLTLRLPRAASVQWFAYRVSVIVAWIVTGYFAAAVIATYVNDDALGADSMAYWRSGHVDILYGLRPGALGAHLYSPAFAQIVHPLTWMPQTAFSALWSVAEAATFAWLLKPLRIAWGVPAFLACLPEIVLGNVYGFFALVLVIGCRWPAAWAAPALTKITPAVGFIWFAARREWRDLTIAIAATGAIALASFAIAPHQWAAWVHFLTATGTTPSVAARLTLGIALAGLAGLLGHRWLLAVAMFLACPLAFHESTITVLAALPRLRQAPKARSGSTKGRLSDELVILRHVASSL